MIDVQPLPVGPCEPTVLHRVGKATGFVLLVAAVVLSVVISPYVFAGFVLVCMAFGVLRWGWRVLRGTEP